MNREALIKVAELLERLPDDADKQFDLSTWDCDSTACAVGWAASQTWFMERGLKMGLGNEDGEPIPIPIYRTDMKTYDSWDAVKLFFDLKFEDSSYLFSTWSYKKDKRTRYDVAARIREFVKMKELDI